MIRGEREGSDRPRNDDLRGGSSAEKRISYRILHKDKKGNPRAAKKTSGNRVGESVGGECRNFGVGVSFFSRVGTVRNAVRWGGDEWNSTMAMMRERFEGHRLKEPPGPAVRWSCYIVVLSRQRRGGRPPYLNCSRLGHKTWKRGDDPAILRTR